MYYLFIQDNKINGCGQAYCENEEIQCVEVSEEVYNQYLEDDLYYVWKNKKVVDNPNYEADKAARERAELDQMTLTPTDVERALYKEKQMDFEDLKALIAQQIPSIDIKALAIEFRAKDFYRGAMANGVRLFDVVGQLLGYSPADMDYLFKHKELPESEGE